MGGAVPLGAFAIWHAIPGHPNLLPAYFDGDPAASALIDHVRKPFFSRQGAN